MIAAQVCAIMSAGQNTLKTERAAFEAYKMQAAADLETDKLASEAYQQQSDAKLKIRGQAADAREESLSQAEKAMQARQTSLTAMEARLNQKALDLAKGD